MEVPMLENIILALVLLVGALAFIIARKPNVFRIERVLRIDVPPAAIFPLINDLHRFNDWSPYAKMDLAMRHTHGGAPFGVGAVYAWDGNKHVGTGRMEIIESVPVSKVTMKLDFFKPFEAHNTAEFVLKPVGASTDVTWAMFGPQVFMGKVMSLFMNMDKMVGSQFEEGLANLKRVTENGAA
jgi:uncharacterized protein YndB with AHSA1/START domain